MMQEVILKQDSFFIIIVLRHEIVSCNYKNRNKIHMQMLSQQQQQQN